MKLERDLLDIVAYLSVVHPEADLVLCVSVWEGTPVIIALDRALNGSPAYETEEAAQALAALGHPDVMVGWGQVGFFRAMTRGLTSHDRARGYARVQRALKATTYSPESMAVLKGLDQQPRRPQGWETDDVEPGATQTDD